MLHSPAKLLYANHWHFSAAGALTKVLPSSRAPVVQALVETTATMYADTLMRILTIKTAVHPLSRCCQYELERVVILYILDATGGVSVSEQVRMEARTGSVIDKHEQTVTLAVKSHYS